MIRRCAGTVVGADDNSVHIALASLPDLVLEINVPQIHLSGLAAGSEVELHTYLHVRAEELSLYGFPTEGDLRVFQRLIRVSGVGPRAACSLLGALGPAELVQAILSDSPQMIAQAPGIGRRTAQKIILELKDRVEDLVVDAEMPAPAAAPDRELIQLLVDMGFPVAQASQAVAQVPEDVEAIEERLKAALQVLG
ncbi:MAG: Holliday junction ATP-dependent DNA helicase RuvA [Caldilineaceae bacterium]|nr:Holliday junction ATP-dependent DNA helicase RuvA [Caldilineaceae bacterium]